MSQPEVKKPDGQESAENPLFQCFGSSYAEAYEAALGVQEAIDPLHKFDLGATERRVDDARELQSQKAPKKKPKIATGRLTLSIVLIVLTVGVLGVTVVYFAGGLAGIL